MSFINIGIKADKIYDRIRLVYVGPVLILFIRVIHVHVVHFQHSKGYFKPWGFS